MCMCDCKYCKIYGDCNSCDLGTGIYPIPNSGWKNGDLCHEDKEPKS